MEACVRGCLLTWFGFYVAVCGVMCSSVGTTRCVGCSSLWSNGSGGYDWWCVLCCDCVFCNVEFLMLIIVRARRLDVCTLFVSD